MEVEIISSTVLKPSGSNLLSKARVPLNIFDRANYNGHFQTLYAFQGSMPSNKDLTIGLSKALDLFPVLRSHVSFGNSRNSCIQLNSGGAKLVEARAHSPLSRIFNNESVKESAVEQPQELSLLYPALSGVEETLQIQITRFSCGGMSIGVTFHHFAVDGHSLSDFLLTWADLVREPHTEDQLLRTKDIKRAVLVPRDPPTPSFNHQDIEFNLITNAATPFSLGSCETMPNIKNVMVEFSPGFITDLRKRVRGRRSNLVCIVAHLWKKITQVRKVNNDEYTHVKMAMDGRMRSRLNMPKFFGNMVLWAYPRLRVESLLNGTFADPVKEINEAIAVVNDEYFKSFIDFGKIMEGREDELISTMMLTGSRLNPHLEVNSLLGFRYEELEFMKGNKLCAFVVPDLQAEGMIMLTRSCKEKSGVVAHIAMLEDEIEEFKRTCFSLE